MCLDALTKSASTSEVHIHSDAITIGQSRYKQILMYALCFVSCFLFDLSKPHTVHHVFFVNLCDVISPSLPTQCESTLNANLFTTAAVNTNCWNCLLGTKNAVCTSALMFPDWFKLNSRHLLLLSLHIFQMSFV